jgi:hypothetical protein
VVIFLVKHFKGTAYVGLRENGTDRLIAAYPHEVDEKDEDIEGKVKFWFYQQSCSAEDELRNYYVDLLSENEFRAMKQ